VNPITGNCVQIASSSFDGDDSWAGKEKKNNKKMKKLSVLNVDIEKNFEIC
jgi:hypothetical protein